MSENNSIDDIVASAISGDQNAVDTMLDHYRPRLRRMVELHLDRRLERQVQIDDVLDEASLDVKQQMDEFAKDPNLPFFIWVRSVVASRLAKMHEQLADRPNAGEVSLRRGRMPQASSLALASKLIGKMTAEQSEAIRAERQVKLQALINSLNAEDREILTMRHFEQLNSAETAIILDVSEAVAGMRFLKALRRLKQELAQIPDMTDNSDGV